MYKSVFVNDIHNQSVNPEISCFGWGFYCSLIWKKRKFGRLFEIHVQPGATHHTPHTTHKNTPQQARTTHNNNTRAVGMQLSRVKFNGRFHLWLSALLSVVLLSVVLLSVRRLGMPKPQYYSPRIVCVCLSACISCRA